MIKKLNSLLEPCVLRWYLADGYVHLQANSFAQPERSPLVFRASPAPNGNHRRKHAKYDQEDNDCGADAPGRRCIWNMKSFDNGNVGGTQTCMVLVFARARVFDEQESSSAQK